MVSACKKGKLIDTSSADNIEDTPSLFAKLEEQNNLGIDNFNTPKEILRGIAKWNLFDVVKKVVIKRET